MKVREERVEMEMWMEKDMKGRNRGEMEYREEREGIKGAGRKGAGRKGEGRK